MEKFDKDVELCEEEVEHNDIIKELKDHMLTDDLFNSLANLYKIFGDATRIKIVYIYLSMSAVFVTLLLLLEQLNQTFHINCKY